MVVGKRSSLMFLDSETRERGVVTGVRSFVEGIRGKEWESESRCNTMLTEDVEWRLTTLSLILQKQVLELVALIGMLPI